MVSGVVFSVLVQTSSGAYHRGVGSGMVSSGLVQSWVVLPSFTIWEVLPSFSPGWIVCLVVLFGS